MLAIHGGKPIRTGGWPKWPQYSSSLEKQLKGVLESGRWTISWPWTGSRPKEQEFAERFAAFNGVPFCVPTTSGSASLAIALGALDIGVGDEVIVPALTWIATAVAVVNVNAIPVLVDVDPDTYCISPEAVRATITPRTRAIIPVHLHCMMADMDEIMSIARTHGLAVSEDCAQAHGAQWRGKSAGSIGDLGAFSMQQSKVLTAGEGGAVITKDSFLFGRLEQLRADGRRFSANPPRLGRMQLIDVGEVLGTNYCMSEFQAAILIDQLACLEEQNRYREKNILYLNEQLSSLGGLRPLYRPPQLEKQTVYEYGIRYVPEAFADRPVSIICEALSAELGLHVYQTDEPLHRNPLYCPQKRRRSALSPEYLTALDVTRCSFPVAEAAHRELIVFHHSVLLGERRDMDDIVSAFKKVQEHAAEL